MSVFCLSWPRQELYAHRRGAQVAVQPGSIQEAFLKNQARDLCHFHSFARVTMSSNESA